MKEDLDFYKKLCTFDVEFDSDEEMEEHGEDEIDQDAIEEEILNMKRHLRVVNAKLKTLMKEVKDGTIQIKRVSKPMVPHNFPTGDSDETMMNPTQSLLMHSRKESHKSSIHQNQFEQN